MVCGWKVIKRAGWVDPTPQRPHGLSYALMLQDKMGTRILGFDNSHAYDGASPEAPWDHEHRPRLVGQALRYEFQSAGALITDFFGRLERYATAANVSCEFVDIEL